MARDLNGSSNHIDFELTAGQISSSIETWSFWIYPDNVGQYRRPIHLGGTVADRDRSFEMDDGWGFVFNFNFSTSGGAWSVAKPSTGSWQHYVVTFDGSSIGGDPVIYKNGISQAVTERVAPVGSLRNVRTDLCLGAENDSGQWWDGRLAEIAIWNRLLSPTDCGRLGIGHKPTEFSPNLIFYAPLLGNDSPEPDIVGGTTGTVTGATQIAHPTLIDQEIISRRMYLTQGFQ